MVIKRRISNRIIPSFCGQVHLFDGCCAASLQTYSKQTHNTLIRSFIGKNFYIIYQILYISICIIYQIFVQDNSMWLFTPISTMEVMM